jgi:hypothetical protein
VKTTLSLKCQLVRDCGKTQYSTVAEREQYSIAPSPGSRILLS